MENVISLDDLFHKRLFRVPDYQRGYSWDPRQVQEFLEDLDLLGAGHYHYMGTVVIHQYDQPSDGMDMDADGNAYIPVDIVDGQQRLTTIILLLDGIRRKLSGLSDIARGLSQGIAKNFIHTTGFNGQRLYKVSLNTDTDFFFKTSILSEKPGVEGPQITSERRLEAAKRQISDYLTLKVKQVGSDGEEWLKSLYRKLNSQLRFTLYQVGDEAEVGVIFEVMNDRGKPLTNLEKVKNYLLHVSTSLTVPNELAKSVNGAWAEILRQLMSADLISSDDEDRLLRAHWLTYYNPQSRLWEGSRSIKERFALGGHRERHKELLGALHRYTEGLRASCICFCDAYHPNRSGAFESYKGNASARSEVIMWSSKLVRINVVATFLPLLLAVRQRWPNDPDRYLNVLKLCETFAFRVYRWSEYRSTAGQAALFRLGHNLATGSQTYEGAMAEFADQLSYWCSDDDFEDDWEDNPVNWYQWSGLRYFLYEYEIALASQEGISPIVEWDELRKLDLRETIEHILPQSIDGVEYWTSKFCDADHERYLHDLGNLTLTKFNSVYQNKAFPDKKGDIKIKGHCYAKSPLFVEKQVALWEDWNPSSIKERRAKLLAWAEERWAVGSYGDRLRTPDWGEPIDEFDEEVLFDDSTTDKE